MKVYCFEHGDEVWALTSEGDLVATAVVDPTISSRYAIGRALLDRPTGWPAVWIPEPHLHDNVQRALVLRAKKASTVAPPVTSEEDPCDGCRHAPLCSIRIALDTAEARGVRATLSGCTAQERED